MKNDTRPLYTVLPEQTATNGSAKKRTSRLRKKILLGSLIALGVAGAAWGFDQYQTMQAKAQFLESAVAQGKTLEGSLLQWGKIQYLKTHATLPVPTEHQRWNNMKEYNEQFLK